MRKGGIVLIIAALFMLTMSGCASMALTGRAKVQQDAFGARKTFAVVTIASAKKFSGEKGLLQTFKKTDDIPGANTQPILNRLKPKVFKVLAKSRHFKLLPESSVLRSKAYRRTPEDKRKHKVLFFNVDMNVAKNYKYFSKPEKLAKLARDLKVDGVIVVNMSFSIRSSKSWISVAGLTLGKKKYSVVASASALAYDREGKVVWKDSAVKEAEPGDTKAIILLDFTDVTKTRFKKLHPSAITIGSKAMDVLLARFSDAVEGRKVSMFQKLK